MITNLLKLSFFLIFIPLILCQYWDEEHYDYAQILEEYYLNFKTNEYVNFYNNFNREGDLVLYQDSIRLTPLKNNSYGLFYTQHVS